MYSQCRHQTLCGSSTITKRNGSKSSRNAGIGFMERRRNRATRKPTLVSFTHAVSRRNERERNRVKLVNAGFAMLRQHVPSVAHSRKLSKVDTLRSAVEYIRSLQELLDNADNTEDKNSVQPSSVSQPTCSWNYTPTNATSPSSHVTHHSVNSEFGSPTQSGFYYVPQNGLNESAGDTTGFLDFHCDNDPWFA